MNPYDCFVIAVVIVKDKRNGLVLKLKPHIVGHDAEN